MYIWEPLPLFLIRGRGGIACIVEFELDRICLFTVASANQCGTNCGGSGNVCSTVLVTAGQCCCVAGYKLNAAGTCAGKYINWSNNRLIMIIG